jgi:hypothetical protein
MTTPPLGINASEVSGARTNLSSFDKFHGVIDELRLPVREIAEVLIEMGDLVRVISAICLQYAARTSVSVTRPGCSPRIL